MCICRNRKSAQKRRLRIVSQSRLTIISEKQQTFNGKATPKKANHIEKIRCACQDNIEPVPRRNI